MVPDERRLRYLADHIGTALEATRPGGAAEAVDLRGYYVWSFMDNFEWSAGYKQPFGLVHVDFDTQVRTPKASYYWLQEVIAARSAATAATAAVGHAAGAAGPNGDPA
jgi:beta-glucosidase